MILADSYSELPVVKTEPPFDSMTKISEILGNPHES